MKRNSTLACFLIFATASVTVHADESTRGQLLPPNRPIAEVIDHYINAKLKAHQIKPLPPASEPALLRRLTLDLVGRIPTKNEVDAHLANRDTDRKSKLVERLMASPEFVRHHADRFTTMLHNSSGNRRGNRNALRDYLRTRFAEKASWKKMFQELMLPKQSDAMQRNAAEFLKSRARDLNKMTVDVSTSFFGVNISCAQCHEHPHVEAWTQDHFYGMKSFFARTFDNGGFLAERSYGSVTFTPNKGKPKTAEVMFLTGKKIAAGTIDKALQRKENDAFKRAKKQRKPAPAPKVSLRGKLVDLALEPSGRHFFSRSIVNRVWYQYFGYGLVMPLDQMHTANPPSHPELLQWLARDMVEHNYDLQRLIRGIVLSETYARSSRSREELLLDKFFARAKVRALVPMQLGRSLLMAGMDPDALPKAGPELAKRLEELDRRAEGLASLFPEPGPRFQVSVKEAMLFSNNERVRRDLLQSGNSLVSRLVKIKEVRERADFAVRTILSRPPRTKELQILTDYMSQREARAQEVCEQIVWALLTSSEFRFNH